MNLALLGGEPSVSRPLPHEVWPPQASTHELEALSRQRQDDIRISGNAGPVGKLEEDFRKFLGNDVQFAIAFNSGTSALYAAYYALGIRPGDQVIGPDLTYHAALSPVYMLGGSVVLADIHEDTRCIDENSVEKRITEKTKAIVVVHQWGHPANMDAVLALAEKHGLRVVEDCSHAHGSRYKGRLCGTFGDVAAFSLQANKAVFAGEGGMLVTNNAAIKDRAILAGHYRDRSKADVDRPELGAYWSTGSGLKLRMSPFNAIVARFSLQEFPKRMKERHQCLQYLNRGLADISYMRQVHVHRDVEMGAWYGFKPLYIEAVLGVRRDSLISALRAEGLEVGVPSGSQLSEQPLYAGDLEGLSLQPMAFRNDPAGQPIARRVAISAISLPTFSSWTQDQKTIDQYIAAFSKVEKNARFLREWESSRDQTLLAAT